jgi:hypothetical protein
VDKKHIEHGPAGDEDANKVGQGLGGATGAAAGAGIGALGGPIGMVIGALAGAAGGWWAGKNVSEAAGDFDDETDAHYRRVHSESEASRDYDEVRPYYQFGRVARSNPDYEGRAFEDVEPELRKGWEGSAQEKYGRWDDVRPYVNRGYSR